MRPRCLPSLLLCSIRPDREPLARQALLLRGKRHRSGLFFFLLSFRFSAGYAPGSMPPLGHRGAFRVIIDQSLVSRHQISDADLFTGSGSRTRHVALTCAALLAASRAEPAPIACGPGPGGPGGAGAGGAAGVGAGVGASASSGGGVGGATTEPGRVAFVADAALGKLTKWLRCLGVDIEYVKEARTD